MARLAPALHHGSGEERSLVVKGVLMHLQLQQQWGAPGAMPKKIGAAALAAVSLLVIAQPSAAAEQRVPFAFEQVVELARQLSQSPARRLGSITPGLEKLNYDQYRELRFRTQKALWSDVASPFRVDLLPAGFVYRTPVAVSLVEDGRVTDLGSDSTLWDVGDKVPANLHEVPLTLSGFRVRARLNSRSGLGRIPRLPGRKLLQRRRARTTLRIVRPRTCAAHGRAAGRGISGIHSFLDRAAQPLRCSSHDLRAAGKRIADRCIPIRRLPGA